MSEHEIIVVISSIVLFYGAVVFFIVFFIRRGRVKSGSIVKAKNAGRKIKNQRRLAKIVVNVNISNGTREVAVDMITDPLVLAGCYRASGWMMYSVGKKLDAMIASITDPELLRKITLKADRKAAVIR